MAEDVLRMGGNVEVWFSLQVCLGKKQMVEATLDACRKELVITCAGRLLVRGSEAWTGIRKLVRFLHGERKETVGVCRLIFTCMGQAEVVET